ncbi:MAG: MATE family efflux transporter [Bacteroidales bacterium]|nr:MATE family efflux transporter [Bacteroidales bacterium]MDD6140673.1 MATE family efflux transporter [Bacteroidales bacterium]MDD6621650.1 MATE family efflux transporter [Bacteroidales bacterium]
MHRRIFAIAVPAIVANIVVPLLGLLDLAIAGHIGATAMIGAVAVGATMFNLTYWNFGFLRMGTSGMTAQAFGRNDRADCASLFVRSTIVAASIGAAIVALQLPLCELLLWAIEPSDDVRALVERYFGICVWGAPALLATMSISGWFVGMQNSVYQMIVSIAVNVTNIVASLVLVFVFDAGFVGIALGTLIAQWVGALLALALAIRLGRRHSLPSFRISRDSFAGMGRFFKINTHIFLRSLCMMAVMLFFTAAGARSGDTVLAVNALIMQLFVVYSYFMDGIAYAGEALCGRYAGEGNRQMLQRSVHGLFAWGVAVMCLFSAVYALGGSALTRLLTTDATVVDAFYDYRLWAGVIPIAGMAAFVWDGVFIGLTATRQMLVSLAVSSAMFFAAYFGISACVSADAGAANNVLWLAFVVYLASRGIAQSILFRRIVRLY